MRLPRHRRAITSVLAILMLAILFTIAVSLAGMSSMNELQAANLAHAESARMQAESGVSFLIQKLSDVSLSSCTDSNLVLSSIAASLGARLNGTPNLHGELVAESGGVVTVPPIPTDANGRSFAAAIAVDSNCMVYLSVTGADGPITKTVRICCYPSSSISGIFHYGMAARGPISFTGNASIRAANDRSEADVLTTASIVGNEMALTGNCTIDGDVSIGPADGNVAPVGNITIGGEHGTDLWKHVNLGAGDVPFPAIDSNRILSAVPVWTDITASQSGNKSFTNIRIKAGTNPNFTGNINIKGVIYVETPNVVRFAGNLNFTGIVVTQDAGSNNTATNAIHFTGNTTSAGVENLPDTSDFHDLREMPGTCLLAPGFETEFVGNFGTINGTMASEKFTWTGNAGGTVFGEVISYGTSTMSLTGNSQLTIDRSRYAGLPPGFAGSGGKLVPNMDSYME